MEIEFGENNYLDPLNDYPNPSDNYTVENPTTLDLASQLLSLAINEHEHLKLRLSQLEKKIQSYREIVHPISALPEDTLREIFVHCIADQDTFLQPRSIRCLPKPVPVCLAQVCSSWRSIAMSMPVLWSTLYVRFHPDRPDHTRITCTQAVEWLARSGTLPLTILVDTSFGKLEDNEDITLFIDSLIQYSHRCRVLRFACPHVWLRLWTLVNPADVPMLQTFEYQQFFYASTVGNNPANVHDLWKSLRLLSTPSLREVGLLIPDLPPQYSLPRVLPLGHVAFAMLTQLYLRTGHASLVEIWHILDRCPQIKKCLLAPGRQNPTDGATIPEGRILTLPHLKTMRLHDTRDSLHETPQFFYHLDLPSLDSFQLHTTSSFVPWEPLQSCLRVTDLCVEFHQLHSEGLRNLLCGNPFIRRLRLASTPLDLRPAFKVDVLPYLFPDPDMPEQTLCPYLETLEIDRLLQWWHNSNLITLLTIRSQLRLFLDLEDIDMTLLERLQKLESTSSVRIYVTYKTLKGHCPWLCRHEKLVQSPKWPLSEWELTGGTLLPE